MSVTLIFLLVLSAAQLSEHYYDNSDADPGRTVRPDYEYKQPEIDDRTEWDYCSIAHSH
jgi:hypothetical protein